MGNAMIAQPKRLPRQLRDLTRDIRNEISIVDVIEECGVGEFPGLNREHPFRGVHGAHASQSDTHCMVDPIANTWRCFSCHHGGGPIEWILHAKYQGDPAYYGEIVKELAVSLGKSYDGELIDVTAYKTYDLLTRLALYWHEELMKSPEALKFLHQKYGFTNDILESCTVGYCSHQPDDMFRLSEMGGAGLINNNGQFRFTDRIIFPYWQHGIVRWMSSRYIGEPPNGVPKYMTLDSNAYLKPVVYNYDDAMRRPTSDPLFIVEGPTDAISAMQHGFRACAVGSASPSPDIASSLAQLGRDAELKYIVMDSEDSGAGERGARATAQLMILNGVNPKIITLPRSPMVKKIDLCDFLRQNGGSRLIEIINHCALRNDPWDEDGIQYYIETLPDKAIRECPPVVEDNRLQEVIRTFAPLADTQANIYIKALQKKLGAKAVDLSKLMTAVRSGMTTKHLEINNAYEPLPYVAQDYIYNNKTETWMAHRAVFIPQVRSIVLGDSEILEDTDGFLYFIVAYPKEGGWDIIQSKTIEADKLTKQQKDKFPSPSVITFRDAKEYSWSFTDENPWSCKNFAMGAVTSIDIGGLYDKIQTLFDEYIIFPDSRDTHLFTLFTFWTYIYMGFSATPYIHCNGAKDSGKTSVLELLSNLCFNAAAGSNVSASSAFRTVHNNRCTLIIDETENLRNPAPNSNSEVLKTICLAGNRKTRTSQTYRTDVDNMQPVAFSNYCPKVFGSIRTMGDVLGSRAIYVQCLSAKKDDLLRLKNLTKDLDYLRFYFQEIRDQLQIWSLIHFREVRQKYDELDLSKYEVDLYNRSADVWMPIFAMAEFIREKTGDDIPAMMVGSAQDKMGFMIANEETENYSMACQKAIYAILKDGDGVPSKVVEEGPYQVTYYGTKALMKYLRLNLIEHGDWEEQVKKMSSSLLVRFLRESRSIRRDAKSRQLRIDGELVRCIPISLNELRRFLKEKGQIDDNT